MEKGEREELDPSSPSCSVSPLPEFEKEGGVAWRREGGRRAAEEAREGVQGENEEGKGIKKYV
jgi:hypothetical protein